MCIMDDQRFLCCIVQQYRSFCIFIIIIRQAFTIRNDRMVFSETVCTVQRQIFLYSKHKLITGIIASSGTSGKQDADCQDGNQQFYLIFHIKLSIVYL